MTAVPSIVPPSDLDAEGAVLSAILLDGSALARLDDFLEPRHFFAAANRRIFEAARAVAATGREIDIVAIAGHLRDSGQLQLVGGSPYLAQLSDATPAVAHVEDHAARIVERWRRRRAVDFGKHLSAEAAGDVGDLATWLRDQQSKLAELIPREVTSPFQTTESVLEHWAKSGPLVHEPTGIARLDELTGGGPVYGSRWYLAGAPDAGKTALLVQLAHTFAERGITVGVLAVDEEADDLVTRLAQRLGYDRHHCEARDPSVLLQIRQALSSLPIRFYDARWTIEGAGADLARFAASRGTRAILTIDSVQTVQCESERAAMLAGRDVNEAAAVTARARAIRAVASAHGMLCIATSELGRSAYRSSDPSQQTSTLSSAKWSGAIEYSARVLIGLRSVSDETDLVELELAKNKHGPRDEKLHLRIDRRAQTLTSVVYEPEPKSDQQERHVNKARAHAVQDAALVVRLLDRAPGMKVLELRAAMRADGIGHDRSAAAVAKLGGAIVKAPGPRGAQHLSINRSLLPRDVKDAIGDEP